MDMKNKLTMLKQELLQKKREIQSEINNYPPPIPACDQQFNHLLGQRSTISQNLRQIDSLTDENEIKAFIESFDLG